MDTDTVVELAAQPAPVAEQPAVAKVHRVAVLPAPAPVAVTPTPTQTPAPVAAPEPVTPVDSTTATPTATTEVPASDLPDMSLIDKLSGGNSTLSLILFLLFMGNTVFSRFSNQKKDAKLQELQEEVEQELDKANADIQKISAKLAESDAKLLTVDAALTAFIAKSHTPPKATKAKTTRKPRAKKPRTSTT